MGLLLVWGLISAAYFVDGIRIHFEGMTSLVPLGLFFTLLLAPVWLVFHFVLRHFVRGATRSLVSMVIPTVAVAGIALLLIRMLNQNWMASPLL